VIALALILAASAGACADARVASVRVVEGMPFVQPLRVGVRVTRRPGPAGGFVIISGGRPVAELALAPSGISVRGAVASRDPRRVDVYAAPPGCPPPPQAERRFDPQTNLVSP
jgi:hypothetical protein